MNGLFALVLSNAWAVNHDVRLCLKIDIEFDDAASWVGDDVMRDNAVHAPASGVWLWVRDQTTNEVVFQGHLADFGTNDGCTSSTVAMSDQTSYTVAFKRTAAVNGGWNLVDVYNVWPDGRKTIPMVLLNSAFVPAGTGRATFITSANSANNTLAVAVHMAKRLPGSVPNLETSLLSYWVDPSGVIDLPEGIVMEADGYADVVHVVSHGEQKYFIAVESGVAYASKAPGSCSILGSYGTSHAGACRTTLNNKVSTATAAARGYGMFLAASAFNTASMNAECWMASYEKVDWNLDGAYGPGENALFALNCEGAPAQGIPGTAYMESMCTDTASTERGVTYDWLRFWWDMRTNSGAQLPGDELASIFADTQCQSSGYYTAIRGNAAAHGYLTAWDDVAIANGVDH